MYAGQVGVLGPRGAPEGLRGRPGRVYSASEDGEGPVVGPVSSLPRRRPAG